MNDITNLNPQGGFDNQDGTKTLQLNHPVTVKFKGQNGDEREEKITSLTFRRCTGGDMRAIAQVKNEIEMSAVLFTRLCNIRMDVYDRLDAEDITRGAEIMEGFLPKSPKTGTK